jgi:hypothetical protein
MPVSDTNERRKSSTFFVWNNHTYGLGQLPLRQLVGRRNRQGTKTLCFFLHSETETVFHITQMDATFKSSLGYGTFAVTIGGKHGGYIKAHTRRCLYDDAFRLKLGKFVADEIRGHPERR